MSDICDCVICSRLLERGVPTLLHTFSQTQEKVTAWGLRPFATPAVYKLARFHYLHNRHIELQHINSTSTTWGELLSQMTDAYEQFSPLLGGTDLTYLLVWQEALAT